MRIFSSFSAPRGRVSIPGSKSHSIRALFFASLAEGVSEITAILESDDVKSAMKACRGFGAEISKEGATVIVTGTGGIIRPRAEVIDIGNSGTSARFALGAAALANIPVTITGDASSRKRPMKPLLDSLARLGAEIIDSADGHLPVTIKGPLKGGRTSVDGTTSQYLSSLLVHTPLCRDRTELTLEFLNEKPYVDMTLNWLIKLGIKFNKEGYSRFIIYPGQKIGAFKTAIPADFSSATFFLALAAVEGSEVELRGLDMEDVQGDKKVIDHLLSMGAEIEVSDTLKVIGKKLTGRTIDLNSTPDALPAMAVVGCLAEGETRLVNVPQARLKETDRIAVMAAELKKMGADIEEKPDGLVIRHSTLTGAKVDGHHDHRVVMSLTLAGLAADGITEISTAESISVTFPDFVELMRSCGANMRLE